MAEETKNNQQPEPEIDRSGIMFTSDAETAINASALNDDQSADEISLAEAMEQNGFVLFFTRLFIKVKNHISIIPMLFVAITMVIITFTIQVHVNATVKLSNDQFNSFWFFINVIFSIMMVLLYININNRKIKRNKWIVMMALFYLVVLGSALIDLLYMRDIRIEINLTNSINRVADDEGYVMTSYGFTLTHFIFLIIDAILAAAAPIVQPFTKKIQILKKK